jgi:CheY-like chemotaxis protein
MRRRTWVAAESAAQALQCLPVEKPDVLMSDIGMPVEDGYALIRQVRALPEERGGNVPAIALTAFARAEDRRRALLAGFQMHLAKPVEPSELLLLSRTLRDASAAHKVSMDMQVTISLDSAMQLHCEYSKEETYEPDH